MLNGMGIAEAIKINSFSFLPYNICINGFQTPLVRRDTTAEELGMDNVFQIGKVGIPDNVLLKQGRLTKEGFEIMTAADIQKD